MLWVNRIWKNANCYYVKPLRSSTTSVLLISGITTPECYSFIKRSFILSRFCFVQIFVFFYRIFVSFSLELLDKSRWVGKCNNISHSIFEVVERDYSSQVFLMIPFMFLYIRYIISFVAWCNGFFLICIGLP